MSSDKEVVRKLLQMEGVEKGECEETYAKASLGVADSELHKVLGINWDANQDTLKFSFEQVSDRAKTLQPTKRNVLKVLAGIFDPS